MERFESEIRNNIWRHSLLNSSDYIIVALSGGADSVALLVALKLLGYRCVAAHCNFHLRGEESNCDQIHAMNVAQRLFTPCEVKHFDVAAYKKEHGVSTEMACRELRYEWFEWLRKRYSAQAIAVAHHSGDDIETMFLNLLRGSGIGGVAAMKWKNGYVVRPMLNRTRLEIEQFLKDHDFGYVVDSTNAQLEYKRNRVRNIVMPALRKAFPDADAMLAKSLSYLQENREIYNREIANATATYNKGDEIDLLRMIREYPAPATLLFEMLHDKGFNHSQALDMIRAVNHTGRKFTSKGWVAFIDRKKLRVMSTEDFNLSHEVYEIDLNHDVASPIALQVRMIDVKDFSPVKDGSEIYLDSRVLYGNPRFVLRRWQNGDKLAPFGMKGVKKLSDIFSDAKLSVAEKRQQWILERDNLILWVVGMRASRHFKIDNSTSRILCIKVLPD